MNEVASTDFIHFIINSGENFNYNGVVNGGRTTGRNNWTHKYMKYPNLRNVNWYGVKNKE